MTILITTLKLVVTFIIDDESFQHDIEQMWEDFFLVEGTPRPVLSDCSRSATDRVYDIAKTLAAGHGLEFEARKSSNLVVTVLDGDEELYRIFYTQLVDRLKYLHKWVRVEPWQ